MVLGIPVGYLIAYLARDELVQGRRWFYILTAGGISFGGIFWLIGQKASSLTAFFTAIVAFISLIKSKDKKFVKKRT